VPWHSDGNAPNTITTHLYFSLTAALALYKPSDTDMVSTARTVCCSFVEGLTLRDKDGLWFDGQSADCTGPDGHKWTYNQGPILSTLGWMTVLTGDIKYVNFGLTTLDAVVNAAGSTPLPQNDGQGQSPFLEVVDGILAESCDGPTSTTCNPDATYFKV
ncbi:hypothetical protein DFH08DRAFT_699879, partial [Mycena albidolilacea]